MYTSPFFKRMGEFKHSDAPDAKGKFNDLSASALASWLIKTRKGNLKKIIGSLNQQVVFNRKKRPSYAAKMKTTMNIVRKRLKKDKAIGGSKTSQHCKGQAIDIDDVFGYKTNAEMYNWVKENLNFDQMIWEFGTDMNPNWVHISYVSEEDNRNRCLKAYKDERGRTKYKVI
jgi:hypothetical protein